MSRVRVEVARRRADWSRGTGALLCQLLELHPWLDTLWLQLAEFYRHSGGGGAEQELWCLERAAQTETSDNVADIETLKSHNSLAAEVKLDIRKKVQDHLSIPKHARNNDVDADFVDLGSSIKTKEREEQMDKVSAKEDDSEDIIQRFEQKWFMIT